MIGYKYVTKDIDRGFVILLQVAVRLFSIEHLLNIVSVGASSLARTFATQFVVLQLGLQLLFPLFYNKVLGINKIRTRKSRIGYFKK